METAATASVSIPEWMTKEYFVDVISVKLSVPVNAFTITQLDVRRATEAGDNYASNLYRVRVSVQVHDTNSQTDVLLIVKAHPNVGQFEEMMQAMNLFPKEMAMYTEILPALELLYHERGREEIAFGPRCLKHSTVPTEVIVMEDLSDRKFLMANRREGLNMDQTRNALRQLAQFHAASVIHHDRNGSYSDLFQDGLFTEKGRAMNEHMQKGQAAMIKKIMSDTPVMNSIFSDLMQHSGMDLFDTMLRVNRIDPTKFNVLNHGDMWCNNMLFHYGEDNQVDDIILLDYQLSNWNSPAIDLLYFIFTSVNGEDRIPQIDSMIQYYHDNLVDSLKFLGYTGKIPLLKELHSDIIAHHLYGLTMCFSILPVCLMEKTEDASMDLMLDMGDGGLEFKKKMYTNPVYMKQMEGILEYFYNMGTFDILQLGTQRSARVECDLSLQLPLWMDREFFEHIVDEKYGTNPVDRRIVRAVHVASIENINNAADIYSAKVDLFGKTANTEETLSLVIKAPVKGNVSLYKRDKDLYARELYVYEQLIPALEALYKNKGVSTKLGPRYYKPRAGIPMEVIVLEDLSVSGYRKASGREGLDKDHAELVLDNLAKFHAASAVYVDRGGNLPAELTDASSDCTLAMKKDENLAPVLDSLFKHMKGWDFAKDFVDDLETVSRQICRLLVHTWANDPEGFNVVNHGDIWLKNMLFSYENGSVEHVTLIDYRNPAWGSPVFDLISFIFSSVSADIKISQQASLLRYYQERLYDNLLLLGYTKPFPTLQQLHIDFNNRLSAAIKSTVIELPYALAEPNEDASQEPGQSPQEQIYENDRFKEELKILLPYFRSRGVLSTDAANC